MITGIVLGSAFSIAFGLAVVALIFVILGDEYPRVESETGPLAAALSMFSFLTAVAAVSFYGLVKRQRWRYVAQLPMWAVVACIAAYYWPN